MYKVPYSKVVLECLANEVSESLIRLSYLRCCTVVMPIFSGSNSVIDANFLLGAGFPGALLQNHAGSAFTLN